MAATALCAGIILSNINVYASEPNAPVAGEVYENPASGKKEYCPKASEFTVTYNNNKATVIDLTIECTEDYDVVVLPGAFIKDSTNYNAIYDEITFRKISEAGKGVAIQEGATVSTLGNNLLIDYIRFDSGSKLNSYSRVFDGWTNLTTVEGLTDAIEPNSTGIIEFGSTFNGCVNLKSITLDFKDRSVDMLDTFNGCNKLQTLVIKNANIVRINKLVVRGDSSYSMATGCNIYPMDITFENIIFPENGGSQYLYEAFLTVSGKITFKNCKAGTSNLIDFTGAFKGSKAVDFKPSLIAQYNVNLPKASGSYSGGNIEISGAKAYSADYMFDGSSYGVIKLDGLITEDTTSAVDMFYNANLVSVNGIKTWSVGNISLDRLFENTTALYDYETTSQQTDYINTEILKDIKSVDLSKVKSCDAMLCFSNEGYIADYRGLNLKSVTKFKPIRKAAQFYTPLVSPVNYELPINDIYYQTDSDIELCGGYKLTKVNNATHTFEGSLLESNTLIFDKSATLKIANILKGDSNTFNVISGYALSEYLDNDTDYYMDNQCKIPATLTEVVNAGSSKEVYIKNYGVNEDLDTGISFRFDIISNNITALFGDNSEYVKLLDYNPTVVIKKESNPNSFVLTSDAKKKAKSQFYTVGINVEDNGEIKQVKRLNKDMVVSVPLPNDYDGKGVIILHYMNGLNEVPMTIVPTIDQSTNTLQFAMDSFSHVAVLYNTAETETHKIKVVWEDDGNYRNRCGITFVWTAYYDGGLTDTGTIEYRVNAQSESEFEYEIYKEMSGQTFDHVEVQYILNGDIQHIDEMKSPDSLTDALTLTIPDKTEIENHTVKVDYSDVTAEDFSTFIKSYKNTATLTVRADYKDGTYDLQGVKKTLASNIKVYDFPLELKTVLADGTELDEYSYDISIPDGYHSEIDYDKDEIIITTEKDVYGDYINFKVSIYPDDNNNANGNRPSMFSVRAIAKFGDKEWVYPFGIACRTPGYTSYSTTISIPGTCNDVPRTSLNFEVDPVDGYAITIGEVGNDYAFIDVKDESIEDTPYKQTVSISFMNDTVQVRPSSIVVNMQDSSGGNKITRTLTIPPYTVDVEVPTKDTYVITSVSGLDNYVVTCAGLTVVAVYNKQPSTTEYTQEFSLNIKDSSNEDGSRPASVTFTVTDGKGSEKTFDLSITGNDRFGKSIKVSDETPWKISKIEGFPERYKVSINGSSATAEYTPEKITKAVSVKFEGDNNNQDRTRPSSVTIDVVNGSTKVAAISADENTNWAANVILNKYISGVEASYTFDCEDVRNYSKTVSGDTITLKFTGTLTGSSNGNSVTGLTTNTVDGKSSDVEEPDFSIDSFDWIDYANRYRDLKRAYGYNKQKLYAHYIHYGIAEGRYATFTGKYSTVNEDILAAYFPDDYKYTLIDTKTDGTAATGTVNTTTGSIQQTDNTVSGNSVNIAEPVDNTETDDGTSDNGDGTFTTKVVNEDGTVTEITKDVDGNIISTKTVSEDGTVTEITKDADGNIISTQQYKTGDARDISSRLMIIFGILLLLTGAYISFITLRTKQPK